MSEPKILNFVEPPFLSGNSSFYDNPNLRDLDQNTGSFSYGYSTDGVAVAGNYSNGATALDYTGMIILNHNLRFGDITKYGILADGSAINGKTLLEVTDGAGKRHSVIKFPRTSAITLGVSFGYTEPTGQEKEIGELLFVTDDEISFQTDFTSYSERWREQVNEIHLGDGGIHRILTLGNLERNLRYEANCQFKFLDLPTVDKLKTLKDSRSPFYFQPESLTAPQKIFNCYITSNWDVRYTTTFKGAGYTVNFNVKEVR